MNEPTELATAGQQLPDDRPHKTSGEAGHVLANRIALARPVSGAVGEIRRTTHVFVAVSGPVTQLTALCGLQVELDLVEFLDGLAGMPCVRCLVTAASRRQLAAYGASEDGG